MRIIKKLVELEFKKHGIESIFCHNCKEDIKIESMKFENKSYYRNPYAQCPQCKTNLLRRNVYLGQLQYFIFSNNFEQRKWVDFEELEYIDGSYYIEGKLIAKGLSLEWRPIQLYREDHV